MPVCFGGHEVSYLQVFFQHGGDLRARQELLVQELRLLEKTHGDKAAF